MNREDTDTVFDVCREEFLKVLDVDGLEKPIHYNDDTLSTDQWVRTWEAIAKRLKLPKVANPEGIPNLSWYSSLAWYARKLINQQNFHGVSSCGRFVGNAKQKGGVQG